MIFNAFSTILLGIFGGIVSSLIVSRVFLIHGDYQNQIKSVSIIIKKLESINVFLQIMKTVFKVDYDQSIEIEQEKAENGYKTNSDYYHAHSEERWISVEGLLNTIRSNIDEKADSIKSLVPEMHIDDSRFIALIKDIVQFAHTVSITKTYSFDIIEKYEREEQILMNRYDNCILTSGKSIVKLILKDKFMIMMYILLAIIVVATIVTGIIGV